MRLGDIATFQYGYTESAKDSGEYRFIRITDINDYGRISNNNKKYVDSFDKVKDFLLYKDDILVARTGSFGKTALIESDEKSVFASYLIRITFNKNVILPKFYWCFSQTSNYWEQANNLVSGTSQPQFNANVLCDIKIPIPSLEIQEEIVRQCEEEIQYIKMTEKMIEKQKEKIDLKLKEIWVQNKDKLKDEPVADNSLFDTMISKASKTTVE